MASFWRWPGGRNPNPDPGTLAGGKLIIVNLVNGQVHAEKSFPAPLTAVDFSPNSATLAIGNYRRYGQPCDDVRFGSTAAALVGPCMVGFIHFSSLATADGWLQVPGTAVLVLDASGANEPIEPILLRGHTSAVLRVELSPDGQTLVSGGFDGTIKVWDLAHVNQSPILHGHETSLGGLAFNGDGDQLDSVDVSGVMRTWRLNDGEPLHMNQSQGVDVLTARVSQQRQIDRVD